MKIRRQGDQFVAVWSDQEIADAAGLSRPSITRWRTGARDPGWSNVKTIEEATGLPFEVFGDGRHVTAEELEEIKRTLYKQLEGVFEVINAIEAAETDARSRKRRSSTGSEGND